jgi:alpha-galactosidase
VRAQFDYTRDWARFVGAGHTWPDADMLPLGRLRLVDSAGRGTPTRLTLDEQRTVMTLWSVFRSPLIIGGDLPTLDAATLALLTNPEVLAVDQFGEAPRQVLERPGLRAWSSGVPESADRYVAVFNLDSLPRHVDLAWTDVGLAAGRHQVRDLWARRPLGAADSLVVDLGAHAGALYRVGAPRQRSSGGASSP